MPELVLIVSAIAGFIVTYLLTPWLIKYLAKIDLVVKDQHKEGTPLVPISGGIAVLCGVLSGLMVFMFFRTFLLLTSGLNLDKDSLILLLVSMITIFTITFIGFIDDLLILKSKEASAGLRQWQKPLLCFAAAIPLMVVKAGESAMIVPFLGHVDFGIWYPLLLVPLGVVGAANMANMLAGFNGLEAGLGIVYTLSLGLYAYVNESYVAALIGLITCAALIAFYFYNKVPAKILAGDSLTYLLGAIIATIAIVGNLEKAALIASIPFIIEFFLKARGRFKKHTIGYIKEGKILSNYKEVYSIPHIFMRTGKFSERQIVFCVLFIEAIFAGLIWVV